MQTLPDAIEQLSFPEMYERWLVGPLFRPFATVLIDELAPVPGTRFLDIACGTGIVARLAKERIGRTGTVVGIDVSSAMLSVARAAAPEIDWREGNASQALPLRRAEQFDMATCHQGLQFFPDKPAAATQMRRAMAKGGRLAIATWRPDDEVPIFRELRLIAERHVGPISDRRHGFGEPAPIEALFRDAGFRDIHSTTISRTVRFEDGSLFLRLNTMALVGMSAGAESMNDEERNLVAKTIADESLPALSSCSDGPALVFEVRSNVTMAGA